MKRVTDFARFRQESNPISMVTCYDAWSARIIADSPIDAVLVGDSVAMVMHGFPDTVHATTRMMADHTAAVRRGIGDRFVITDMPFPEHRKGVTKGMQAVDTIMKAGANAVKIEGARGHLDFISHVVESGVPVMGHLGLTPQSVHQFGGYRVQGKDDAAARRIYDDALSLEQSGAFAIVLECIPAALAAEITRQLTIPTIGIGSGPECSGQILVLHDLLGMSREFRPRFLRTYSEGADTIGQALSKYDLDVKNRNYPSAEESFYNAKLGNH
jgi:3-methyl-2-oxobutanoate hydroxymethyltransferase